MDGKLKQRVVIEFLTKEGCSAAEIHMRLKNVYGDSVIDVSNVRRWVKKFREGETEIEDKPRCGRPSTSVNVENEELVDDMIRGNRRITIAEIEDTLEVSYGSVQTMITELDYRKVCAKWVPRQLTPDLKERRVDVCTELLEAYETNGDRFFSNLVTGDETWAHLYDPESKRQSMEWRHPDSPRPRKFKTQRSSQKVLATVFWDNQGVLLIDFLEHGRTVNSDRYIATLKKLRDAIRRKRPGNDVHDMKLHHDNARPHTSLATTAAIARMGWSVVPHPPYSPDLAPSDFHLFPSMKEDIRGQRFDDLDEVKRAIHSWVRQCPQDFFRSGFLAWMKRWRKCVEGGGDYVET